MAGLSPPERTVLVRRAVVRLCLRLGWAPVHEVALPNGRRADVLAMRADGGLACIEIKSCQRDFLSDTKWLEYLAWCDCLYFAVDADFPQALLPDGVGVIVACPPEADVLRAAPATPMPPARRREITRRFAWLAANRLATLEDPMGAAMARAALLVE